MDSQPIESNLSASQPADVRQRRARRVERWQRVGLPVLLAIVLAAIWQVWAMARHEVVLPTFVQVVQALGAVLGEGEFWRAMGISNVAVVLGFGLAAVIGVPLGLAMGRVRALESAADLYLNIALVIPMAVILPIVLIALGLDLRARVTVIFLFALPFIVVPVRAGMRTISAELFEMAHSFGASELWVWRKILIPGTLPATITGLRQGFGHAITGMLIIELTMISVGIGDLLQRLQANLNYPEIFAFVAAIIAESLIVIGALRIAEQRLTAGGRQQ
jgi:ABC-type nitrate/sulfonate/bicarbonate transport system permease component